MSAPSQIGHYKVVSKLGEGGMGAVYRAVDTRLNREVAIKVLPAGLAENAARMARFEREAQLLATLNHPNIAGIYGIEQGAIVMELVEGSELTSPVPIETAIAYARQIATALEAAHEKGVIHRDLKPANIKVTPEGVIKLLDFGLAKATEESSASGIVSPTLSPTLSLEMTRAGMILGTAAYMAPEQARGAAVDKRADIWAFGVVLLEMLTGKMPFRGETVSDTLADVLRAPIDWKSLPAGTPPGLRGLLERCLERDPRKRLRDIGEARILLSDPESLAPAPPVAAARKSGPAVWTAVVVTAVACLGIGAWIAARFLHPASGGVTRLSISLPAGQILTGSPIISRDGRVIAYTARTNDGRPHVYIRSLNGYESSEISDSDGARLPFFSPDGARVAFFARGKLMIVARTGGAPAAIADASYVPIGGTWGDDDFIYYTPALSSGILRIPSSGGKPEKLTNPDEAAKGYAHVWPQYLFDTHSVLFSIWGGLNMGANGTIILSPAKRTMVSVSPTLRSASYAASGYLLASGVRNVMAAPFNPAKLREVRPNTSVLEDVFSSPNLSASWFSVSDTGTLVYVPGDPSLSTLAWVDRSGTVTPITDKPQPMADPSLSPDGTHVVVTVDYDLWVQDLRRGTNLLLTAENQGSSQLPIWSRDGSRIVFGSNRSGDWDIYSIPAAGGSTTHLLTRKGTQFPISEAPDGSILFSERSLATGTGADIWKVTPDGVAAPFIVSPASKVDAQFSPDGRLVAYVSDETGRNEVYLRSVADPSGRIALSSEGGSEPKWSPDGKEIFYRRGDAFLAVGVNFAGALSVTETRKMFAMPALFGRYTNHAGYAVAPDGRHFLILRPDPRAIPTQINVVLNWFEELKSKVPAQ